MLALFKIHSHNTYTRLIRPKWLWNMQKIPHSHSFCSSTSPNEWNNIINGFHFRFLHACYNNNHKIHFFVRDAVKPFRFSNFFSHVFYYDPYYYKYNEKLALLEKNFPVTYDDDECQIALNRWKIYWIHLYWTLKKNIGIV